MIDPEWERWDRLEAILRELEEVPEGERDAYLARVSPDPELRRSARLLLADKAESSGYLEGLFDGLAPERGERADLTGRRIGAYRLLRLVARGGMGAVYEAERADGAFEQRVALKLLTMALAGGEAHERFLAERRVLAGLGHPAIAHIVDGGVADDGTPWFAMEYVEGLAVDVYCDRRQLDIRERLELFLQVCDAVEHAHRRLVVHRDLKPANVLVTEEGQVKLLDFGIAKLLDPGGNGQMVPPTRTALRLMTPEYASPEQVRGERVTTASDVYQLGILLYELLTGHRPYPVFGRSPAELEQVICKLPPTRPSAVVARASSPARLRRRLRGDLDNIVLKALRKEPERRYGSADRLAQDIRRHLRGLPVTARADTWIYRGRKFLERHALGASATAAVLVLVAGLTMFYVVRIQNERDQARIERGRAQAEAAKAEQMNQFLTGLFRSADPQVAGGEEVTARELLDRGVERVDQELSAQPESQADMLRALGRTYTELGLHEQAEHLLTRALDLHRRQVGSQHPDIAQVLRDIGWLRYREARYRRAVEQLEGAVRILEGPPEKDPAELADVLRILGPTYRHLGEHEKALARLERALSLQERATGDDSEPVALILNNMGNVLLDMGARDRAEDLFERALTIHERELGPDHPLVNEALTNLAIFRLSQGRLDGLEPMYRRGLAIAERAYGPEHSEVGIALNNLGNYLTVASRNEEAIDVLQQALEVLTAAVRPNHPHVAITLATLGDAYHAVGRDREARHSLRQSVASREKDLGVRPVGFDPVLAYSLARLGRIEAKLGNGSEAEQILDRAARVWGRAPDSIDSELAPALLDLGRWLVGRGRCAEALPLLRRGGRIQLPPQSPWSPTVAELKALLAECASPATDPVAAVAATR